MTDCIEPRLWVDYATASNDEIEGRRALRGRGRHEGKQEQDGKQQTHEVPRLDAARISVLSAHRMGLLHCNEQAQASSAAGQKLREHSVYFRLDPAVGSMAYGG
jgi:hypothetical protein